ncbi:hypothetical protein EXT68_08010 [Pectobacterium parmentieri]|uniref:Membrane protein n=1 Tax=Pectobacterium parmentieri TaxID=1905730 RepID=A0A0H3I5B5_PECPM|nr:hypothetical protein [Pectobacterium parmentieri]AFI91204.1 Putative membrane protein [Pectobacterium parmentieri]MBI0470833.1 hypothetical protein [Pectobacterium parmentieri]MBI0493538.1 hypothetical protein [Pectobacterium parmentieri]MBI0554220.1 hypothetical protein [Pectobacterium parmentieri]MBI0567602.1 hypothetical protein [Pectobacterium parmentieri]
MKVLSTFFITYGFSHVVPSRQKHVNQSWQSIVRARLNTLLLNVALLFCFIAPTYAANIASFNISSQEFADRMNANLTQLNIPLKLTINLEKGHSVDDFQHIFNEHVGLIGSAEKQNQQLTELIVFSASSESAETATQNLQIVTAVFSALLSENNIENREVTEMMFGLLQDSRTSGKGIRQVGNTRFTATTDADADIIFTAKPVR